MADETGKTSDTTSVSPLSTQAPGWRPDDTAKTAGMSSGNGAAPAPTGGIDAQDVAPDESMSAPASPLPLVVGLAAAGLATAGVIAFFVSRRSAGEASRATPLLSSDTVRAWTDSASDQLDDLRSTLKQQLIDRPRRAARPLRRDIRRSTAPLRRGIDNVARTTRDVQRNARDAQREVAHAWQRTKTGGLWWRRGMVWGGALGILLGFLLAPKPGHELRADIARGFERVRPQVDKLYQQGKAQVDRFTQSRQG